MEHLSREQLVGIRDLSGLVGGDVDWDPMFRTAQLLRCRFCSVRYWVAVEKIVDSPGSSTEQTTITAALVRIAQRISDEHELGHKTRRFAVSYQADTESHHCATPASDDCRTKAAKTFSGAPKRLIDDLFGTSAVKRDLD
jgi:hypothetical protein